MNNNIIVQILLSQLSTVATIVTAFAAFSVYRKTKLDELENAVRIIVLEIKESEKIIKNLEEIKNSGNGYPNDLVKVIPMKGWSKYSHLFMKKLNNDEYDQLNDYFKQCEVLEKYIEKNHNFFWITTEERARINEQLGARLAFEEQELKGSQFKEKLDEILAVDFTYTSGYTPTGIKTQMDRILNSITLVTVTPVWNKLKSIAKYDDLLG